MSNSTPADENSGIRSCPTCGSSNVAIIRSLASLPLILFPVNEEQRDAVREAPLEASCCYDCDHIFQYPPNEEFVVNLYKDYYHYYPFKDLESMQAPYREPFQAVVDIFLKRKNARLLEVGCDSVAQMRPFLERGYSCTAINPGAQHDDEVTFIDGFYGSTEVNGAFDYVIMRFNLEHTNDLSTFFKALRQNMSRGGFVMTQVPNAEYFLKMGMLNIFAHEHHHYFCRRSILALIRRYGYEPLYMSEPEEPSLICVFCETKSSHYDPRKIIHTSAQTLEELRQVIRHANARVFFYGASLSLCAFLYGDGADGNVAFEEVSVIDDNPLVQGRYMPNTSLKISSLAQTHIPDGSIVVLSLNEIYHVDVLKRLSGKCEKCRIMAITGKGLVDVDL